MFIKIYILTAIITLVSCSDEKENKNIRVDTGVYEGGEVSMFYDAMIEASYAYNKWFVYAPHCLQIII